MRLAIACVLMAGCGDDPVFPADYSSSFVEVRNCRSSSDHEFHRVRVLADPAALPVYQARDVPFPLDAIVLKEEYGFGDDTCSGPIVQWTVMQQVAGSANGGWKWQRVDVDRGVVSEDDHRCVNCHANCGVPPEGYDGTCAVP
jgi:hypothetical protein